MEEKKIPALAFTINVKMGPYGSPSAFGLDFEELYRFWPRLTSGTKLYYFGVVGQELPGRFCGFEIPSHWTRSGVVDVKFENGVDPSTVFFVVWNKKQLESLRFPEGVTVLLGKK